MKPRAQVKAVDLELAAWERRATSARPLEEERQRLYAAAFAQMHQARLDAEAANALARRKENEERYQRHFGPGRTSA